MTGYGRAEGAADGVAWAWEIKSVNGRGLEVRSRLGNGFEHLEPEVRKRAAGLLGRGNVSVSLRVSRTGGDRQVTVNRDLLGQLLDAARDVAGDGPPPSVDALLAVPGVIEITEPIPSEEDREALDIALMADLDRALVALAAARGEEGGRTGEVLSGHLDTIARLTDAAGKSAATQPTAIRDKLIERINGLIDGEAAIDPERLAQEAALLAVKADVAEELDRLVGHVAGARELLEKGGLVGRQMDFLSQEFAREANTLCAKSADAELTQLGLELKAVIDRLREQVQNLE
ncbi:MAG: YicC family protein [Alphaproteobacteria bacterium]|nr:YicC family protein [Alphaproteobacteria bacterium]MBT5860603.1 YicC family protein [Alphaproteobacteria bacterium]